MRTELLVPLAFVALAALASAGCPGYLQHPEQYLGPCLDPPTEIFPQRCGDGECHDEEDPAGELDLLSAEVEERLVHVDAEGGPGTLVDPDNLQESILWIKVTRNNPPFGTRMPQIGASLSVFERQCLLEWMMEL